MANPTDTSPEALDALHRTLPNVGAPEHMHGDNLAILLCSFFEDAEGEANENGWTDAAIAGQEAVLDAIRAHYGPTLLALRARLAEAERQRDAAIAALSEAARARGEAEGRLEAAELPGIVEGWKARAERAEAAVERAARLALERAAEAVVAAQTERCRSCGHPRNNHPYRHMFVGAVGDYPAAIRALTPAAIAAEAMKGEG